MKAQQKYQLLTKKSIERPYIRRDSFQLHQIILDNFIHKANKEVEAHNQEHPEARRYPLTEAHRSLMEEIYFEAVSQYEMRLSLFENTDLAPLPLVLGHPVRVNTNNKDLAYRLSRSAPRAASTIYRRLERIRECGGIVGKLNHGTKANYDLYINPELILLWDANDADYHPSSVFLKGGDSAVYLPRHAKCKPSKGSISYGKNKKTIAVHSSVVDNSTVKNLTSSEHEKMLSPDGVKTFLKTPEAVATPASPAGSFSETEEDRAEKDTQAGGAKNPLPFGDESAQKRAFTAAEYLYKYAVWLLWGAEPDKDNTNLPHHLRTLYGGNLWDGQKIHRPEEVRAITYLATRYFCHDTSPVALERQVENMQHRLRLSLQYLQKQNYYRNGQWYVTPTQFFDQDNKKGFVGTYRWISQAQEWKERKQKQSSYRKRMLNHLERYLQNPTLEEYTRQLSAIKKAVPHLEAEFIQRATNAPMGKPIGKKQAGDGFQEILRQMRECRLSKQPFVLVNP
jgi:hypothetical protein